MKKFTAFLVVALFASLWLNVSLLTSAGQKPEQNRQLHWISDVGESVACFTPGENCTQLIVDAIDAAQEQVLVQAYHYTSEPILQAIARAKSRGLDVRIIFDADNELERYSGGTCMVENRIPVLVDDTVAIAHSKIVIIDRRHVLRGSFNFTAAAQKRNSENTELTRNNPQLVKRYLDNWEKAEKRSRPFHVPHNKCKF